jgi:hypothetical protein
VHFGVTVLAQSFALILQVAGLQHHLPILCQHDSMQSAAMASTAHAQHSISMLCWPGVLWAAANCVAARRQQQQSQANTIQHCNSAASGYQI